MVGPIPIRDASRSAVSAPSSTPRLPMAKNMPDGAGGYAQLVDDVEEQDHAADVAEQVQRAGAGGDVAQVAVPEDVAQALDRLGAAWRARPPSAGSCASGASPAVG